MRTGRTRALCSAVNCHSPSVRTATSVCRESGEVRRAGEELGDRLELLQVEPVHERLGVLAQALEDRLHVVQVLRYRAEALLAAGHQGQVPDGRSPPVPTGRLHR
jgi:hypothetical protein